MYHFNASYNLSNHWVDTASNHLFFAMLHAKKAIYNDTGDDGLVTTKSGLGLEYPRASGSDYLLGYYATREEPTPDACNHYVGWWWYFVRIDLPVPECHEYSTHSAELALWITSTSSITNYNANYLPDLNKMANGVISFGATSPSYPAQSTSPSITQPVILLQNQINLASNSSVTIPLNLDNVTDVAINVGTNITTTSQVQLEDAAGNVITSTQSLPASFSFPNNQLAPGNYSLAINAGVLTSTATYGLEVTANSGLGVSTVITAPTVGSMASGKISVNLSNGISRTAVTGANVTAALTVYPSAGVSITSNITLVDSAGNGNYTAMLPPALPAGNLAAIITASGTLSGTAFNRVDHQYAPIRSGELVFNTNSNAFSWQTLSKGSNATADIDAINLSVPITVQQSGVYKVEAALAAADGNVVSTRSTTVGLDKGSNTITIAFDGLQIQQQQESGPYHIISMIAYLESSNSRETDAISDTSIVPLLNINSNQLHQLPFVPDGTPSDSGANPDSNGRFQNLQVNVPLDIAASGIYSYSAALYNITGTLITTLQGQTSLQAGTAISLTLNFDGRVIYGAGSDGLYVVKDLVLKDPVSSQVLLYINTVGQTQSYHYAQFAAPVPPTSTPVPPTVTNTATSTPVPPTATPTPPVGTCASISQNGWIAAASASYSNYLPANAVDGNLNTRWTAGQSQVAGTYFMVDMGSLQTFNQIVMNNGNEPNDSPAAFDVFVSTDGANFGNAVTSATGVTGSTTVQLGTQTARYIKVVLRVNASNWWSIDEFNAFYCGTYFTPTSVPTATPTPVPPTATSTATPTPVPPTATSTATPTPSSVTTRPPRPTPTPTTPTCRSGCGS